MKESEKSRRAIFTLPCRGRVARRSEAQAWRGGAVPQAPISWRERPHPGSPRSSRGSPTLPLQGRVKRASIVGDRDGLQPCPLHLIFEVAPDAVDDLAVARVVAQFEHVA